LRIKEQETRLTLQEHDDDDDDDDDEFRSVPNRGISVGALLIGGHYNTIALCETLTMAIQRPKYTIKVKNDCFFVDCVDAGLITV